MGFPSQVNVLQALALAGDFADKNPRATVTFGGAGLVASTGGLNVGTFAWADLSTGLVLNSAGSGVPSGFVAREQQALITSYLAEAGSNIPAGQPVTLFSGGAFYATNSNAAGATAAGTGTNTVGMKVFVKLTDGTIRFAATGASAGNVTGYVETKWVALSVGAVGELVKISTHVLG